MRAHQLLEQRRARDEFFRTSHHSPLPREKRHEFEGLDYYDPNPGLVFTVPIDPGDRSEITIQTTDGQERVYRRAGRVTFEVDGEPATLMLYSTGHQGYFVPFRDKTSGDTTYGAGRYLDVEPNDDGTVTIDFNLAYNPSCVYDQCFSCPIPPMENWLQVPIAAGEKTYPTR
jgi:uncharacterized protein